MIPNIVKKSFFEHALELGEVFVRIDSHAPGVQFPEQLNPDDVKGFSYGLNQPKPIPDLVIGDDGIEATLSFQNQPYPTFVPWEAVYAMAGNGCGVVFAAVPATPKVDPARIGAAAMRGKLRSV